MGHKPELKAPSALLKNARVVLVSPMYAGNIGSVARVAANFDLEDLVVVSPECDPKGEQAVRMAKGPARAFLERVRVVSSLAEAIADREVAVGFTRRLGALRVPNTSLDDLASRLSKERVALVFGREDGGLSTDELLACTQVCSLPTAELMPSLNLSHAVAVVAARLFELRSNPSTIETTSSAVGEGVVVAELEAIVEHWAQAMRDAGLESSGKVDRMTAHFRRILQRAEITQQEAGYLRAYLSKTQVAMGKRRRGKPVDSKCDDQT